MKKIKKLGKGRVWPAVVLLVFSVILTYLFLFVIITVMMTYFATDRLNSAYDETVRAANMFAEVTEEVGAEKILEYLQNGSGYFEAVYLLDENNVPVAGFGNPTYDLEKGAATFQNADFSVYLDKEDSYNQFFVDGNFDVSALLSKELNPGILKVSIKDSITDTFKFDQKKVFYKACFWVCVPLEDNRTLMAKAPLKFYSGDLRLAVALAALSLVVMQGPILFLFIHVILSAVNQRRSARIIYTDAVTSGKSWIYFENFAEKALYSREKAGRLSAVADISLMKYRTYCTCHGVTAGEELLERTDKQLTSYLKKGEYCAHNGKASFALMLKCENKESCVERVQNMIQDLENRLKHGGITLHGGICFVMPAETKEGRRKLKRQDVDAAEFYNRASAARASIADENVSMAAVFDQKLLEEQLWEHRVEEKMQRALENEEFQVYIQPKYNPVTEQLAGAEALIRWVNEEDGFIPPGRFIPIFEKNGFITKIDDYMISHVAKLQAEWLAEGKEVVPVSVNVSRAHFANPDLARHICELVDAYKLPHHLLEIELTESAFFDDKAALLRTVRELKELGFDISMDDFGAGYSSLNSLKDLPLDVLKLDADFFRGEDDAERGEIVVAQAINLAKKLNMRIVAEGVEKKNQVDFLASQDCDMIQGYYFAKPMPAGEYADRLVKHDGEGQQA